jgi:hypothetical protein
MTVPHKRQVAWMAILLAAGIVVGWALRTVPQVNAPGGSGETEEQLASALQHRGKEDRSFAVRAVFAQLDAEDLVPLREHVQKLSEEQYHGWFLANEFYRRWGELAPRAALEFLKSDESDWAGLESAVWSAWARTDPDAAMAAYDPSLEGKYSRELQDAVLEGLSASDPAKALRFADEREIGHDGIFASDDRDELDERDSVSRYLLEFVPITRPSDPFGLAIYSWIYRDPEGALNAILPLKYRQLREASLNALFSNWIMLDRNSAIKALDRIEDRSLRESVTHTAMQAYLFRYPKEALEIIVALPPFEEESPSFRPRDPFAEEDPFEHDHPSKEEDVSEESRASEDAGVVNQEPRPLPYRFCDTTPTRTYGKMNLISEAGASLGLAEGRLAWDAAAAIKDDNKRAAALGGALAGWLGFDIESAAKFVAAGVDDGSLVRPGGPDFPGFATRLVGKMLAQHDFQKATNWIEALPPGPLRDGAIETAAKAQLDDGWHRALAEASPNHWVDPAMLQQAQLREYAPVVKWLDLLPPSKGRDEAAFWLVFRLEDGVDLIEALRWAATIDDARLRRICFEDLANKVLPKAKDVSEAAGFSFETWSATHPELAEELRQELARKKGGPLDHE